MTYLLLSVLLSGYLLVFFKHIARYNLPLLPVIAVNYATCVLCGLALTPHYYQTVAHHAPSWVPLAVAQGSLFISLFFLIAYSAQRMGLGLTALLNKMSLIIPTLLSYLLFSEHLGGWQWVGIALALVSIAMIYVPGLLFKPKRTTQPTNKTAKTGAMAVILGLILFVGSGTADFGIKLYDVWFSALIPADVYSITLFGVAGVIGLIISFFLKLSGWVRLGWREILAGIVLGIPNYFSLVVMMYALDDMPGAIFFPLNNIGQLLLVTLVGTVAYREKLQPSAIGGLACAVASILLLSGWLT